MKDRQLITVDKLRAAGALDVPPAWRKSLGAGRVERDPVQRSLFSALPEDEDAGHPADVQSAAPSEAGSEESEGIADNRPVVD